MANATDDHEASSSEPQEFAVSVKQEGAETVVTVRGEVDLYTAPTLRKHLDEVVMVDAPTIVVDMTALDFIDSTGLGVLVGALKEAENRGGQVRLRGPGRSTMKILEISGLTEVFTIE